MALPIRVGIRDVVTALPDSPRAVLPTDGQISPPDLLHGARAACSQYVCWQCPDWKPISPKQDEACRREGLLGSGVAAGTTGLPAESLLLSFIKG